MESFHKIWIYKIPAECKATSISKVSIFHQRVLRHRFTGLTCEHRREGEDRKLESLKQLNVCSHEQVQ